MSQPDILFEVENFQAIPNFKLPLTVGFHCFTGRSNIGKSALIRSLRAFTYNELHPSFIRKGEKECKLKMTFSPEISPIVKSIELAKASNKNVYTVVNHDGTGKAYPKIGAVDTPQELKDLGFELLQTEREEFYNLNFQAQLEALFLVTDTPTSFTSFINKIFGIAKYERALRDINADIIKGVREYDALTPLILQKRNEVQERQGVAQAAAAKYETFKAAMAQFTELNNEVTRRQTALQEWRTLLETQQALKTLYQQTSSLRATCGDAYGQLRDYLSQRQGEEQWKNYKLRSIMLNLEVQESRATWTQTQQISGLLTGFLTQAQNAGSWRTYAAQLSGLQQQFTTASQDRERYTAQAIFIGQLQAAYVTRDDAQRAHQQALNFKATWVQAQTQLTQAQNMRQQQVALRDGAEQLRTMALPLYRSFQAREARAGLDAARTQQEAAKLAAQQEAARLTELRQQIQEAIGFCPTCNRSFAEHTAHAA